MTRTPLRVTAVPPQRGGKAWHVERHVPRPKNLWSREESARRFRRDTGRKYDRFDRVLPKQSESAAQTADEPGR
jgi:hypothetical protein